MRIVQFTEWEEPKFPWKSFILICFVLPLIINIIYWFVIRPLLFG